MAEGDERSLHEMKRRTEATRADLTQTVDQLKSTVTDTASEIRDRLRPEAIKAEVSGYIKNRGQQLFQDIEESARRNPIQAVAVGASLAYPLMRVARAIPMPILMIGAGLFFASSKTGRDLTQKASDTAADLSEETRRRASAIGDQAVRATASATDYVSTGLDQAGAAVTTAGERFRRSAAEVTGIASAMADRAVPSGAPPSGAGPSLTDRLEHAKSSATDLASDAIASVRQSASTVGANAGETLSAAADMGQEMLQNTRDYAADMGQKATQSLRGSIEQNPLLVAGVGLLIGGLIASALPKWQAEDKLLGGASDAVKKRAAEAANSGLETAKGAAGEILTHVARQADAEGLTPEGLSETAKDIGGRIQRVAERAVTTAFEPETQNHEPVGGQHNG